MILDDFIETIRQYNQTIQLELLKLGDIVVNPNQLTGTKKYFMIEKIKAIINTTIESDDSNIDLKIMFY